MAKVAQFHKQLQAQLLDSGERTSFNIALFSCENILMTPYPLLITYCVKIACYMTHATNQHLCISIMINHS